MPLLVITGAANTGKTGFVYARIREALDGGARPVLLLPSAADVERARREFAATHPVGLTVARFDAYLANRWRTRGDGRRLVQPPQRHALMSSAIREAGGEVLREVGEDAGTVHVLARLAKDSAATAGAAGRPSGEAGELYDVVGSYRELLGRHGLVEPGEAFSLLSADPPACHGPVAAHRFTDLAPHQEAYLRGLSERGVEVLVSLTWVEGFPATAATGALVRRLSGDGTVVLPREDRHTRSEDLRAFTAHLFAPPAQPLPPPSDVVFGVCGDAEDEVERAAEEAARAISSGVPAEEVALVYRDPWPLARGLRRALADRGLSCDLDFDVPLRALPLSRAAAHLLRFALTGARSDLLSWLRSPYSPASAEEAAALEAGWRRQREERTEVLAASAVRAVPAARGPLLAAGELARRRVDAEWATAWAGLVHGLLEAAHPGDAPLLGEWGEEDAQGAAGSLSIAADAADARGADLGASDVLVAIETARAEPARAERPGRVQVVSALRARSRRFAVVIVGGLTADGGSARSDDTYRAGAVGAAARALGVPERAGAEERERAEFYAVATRARERLVLLTHTLGEGGEPCAASAAWTEALEVYRAQDAEEGTPAFVDVAGAAAAAAGARRRMRGLAERMAEGSGEAVAGLSERDVFSPGELETYLSCPVRWLRDRWLRPRKADARFDALESGRLVHDVLRETLRALPAEAGVARVTPESLPVALRLARQAFEAGASALPEPRDIDERDRLETAWDRLEAFLGRDAAFVPRLQPVGLELGFGLAPDDDPVDLGDLKLRGRVDRIDSDGGVSLVVDYKTGDVPPPRDFGRRGLLQLQLYTVALRTRGMPVAGAVYRSLRSGRTSGFYLRDAFRAEELPGAQALDAAAFEEVLDDAVRRARDAAEGIRQGRLAPDPAHDACRYCAVSHACERGAA
ncbi:MAG: PD-(D/E)XK nuclease family protein [Coriobacteriia bacterium]|nr:PD-(D/E)XK nuclease family protein [Coriobacteriia bacterium]